MGGPAGSHRPSMGPLERLIVSVTLGATLFIGVAWLVIISIPFGWAKKMCLFYTINAGLYRIELAGGVTQKVMGAVAATVNKHAEKKLRELEPNSYTPVEFTQYMCQLNILGITSVLGGDPCSIFGSYTYSAYALIILVGIASCFLFAGCGMMYMWAFKKSHRKSRQWIMGIFGTAFFLYLVGIMQYAFISDQIKTMPPITDGTSWGFSVMFAFALTAASIFPVVVAALISKTEQEMKSDDALYRKKLEMYAQQPAQYGAVYPASGPGMGGFPPENPAGGPGMGGFQPVYPTDGSGIGGSASGQGPLVQIPAAGMAQYPAGAMSPGLQN